jgi:MFS family permease
MPAYTRSWYLTLSSYWFATSFKWFSVLLVLLPARVADLVPEAERASRLGFLAALGAVMAFLGPPLMGYLSDRIGRRMPFLAIGAVVTAGALVLMAYAPSYAVLVLAYILLQLGDDLSTGPYSALIPDLVPPPQRGVASGYMGSLQVGGQIGAGLAGFLIPTLTLQFLLVALLVLLCATLTLSQIREVKGLVPRRRGLLESLISPWQNPDFRWVWLTRFLVMLGQYGVQTYLQYYLADVVRSFEVLGRKLASEAFQAVAVLGLLISLGAVFSAVPAGRASDRIGRKKIIYIAGGGLALLMIPLLLFPRFDVMLGLSLLFGLFFGAYLAVDWALVADVLPDPRGYATDMGIWQTSVVLPQVIVGSLGGLLGQLNNQSPGMGYTWFFVAAGLAFALGTLWVGRIRSSR